MRPNTLIDSLRWAPQRSIVEDIQLLALMTLFATLCPFLAAAVAIAVMQ